MAKKVILGLYVVKWYCTVQLWWHNLIPRMKYDLYDAKLDLKYVALTAELTYYDR